MLSRRIHVDVFRCVIVSDDWISIVVRTGSYNCPGLMVWYCTLMLILYIKGFVLQSVVLLYVTRHVV